MKTIFSLILLTVSSYCLAANRYFSTSGSDSNTGTKESPWKTVTKVSNLTISPGDSILFKRGDVFEVPAGSSLYSGWAGTSGNPIIFGAYGTGENPVISGFQTVSSWTLHSTGIYKSYVPADAQDAYTSVYVVTVDGSITEMGRYPNSGWLSYDQANYDGNFYFIDAGLPSGNWVGAEAVMRKVRWMVDRNPILSQSGTRVNYSKGSNWNASAGYGYFLQNSIRTLDQLGEWYYHNDTLYMYFGAVNPATKTVKMGIRNTGITVDNNSYQTFVNLTIEGINWYAFNNKGSHDVVIKNCTFRNCGAYGILNNPFYGGSSMRIEGNTLTNILGTAINLRSTGSTFLVKGNTISNIGLLPGSCLLAADDVWGDGIVEIHDNSVIEYNTLTNIGHIPIKSMTASGQIIRYNFISNFGLTRYDAGGIYTWDDSNVRSGNKIHSNIVVNSKQTSEGIGGDTYLALYGIYHDEHCEGYLDSANTVYNCSSAGLLILASEDIAVKNNTFYANGQEQVSISDFWFTVHVSGLVVKNNFMIAKAASQLCLKCESQFDEIPSFGTFDNNYYVRPIDDDYVFSRNTNMYSPSPVQMTLSGWRTYSYQDAHSLSSPVTISDTSELKFYYNNTSVDKVFSLSQQMRDLNGMTFSSNVTLQPYTSIVLLPGSGSVSIPGSSGAVIRNTSKPIKYNNKPVKR